MINQLNFLARKDELEFEKKKFKGKLAGKSWKYSRNLSALLRTRALIFLGSIFVIIPAILNSAVDESSNSSLILIERLIFAVILIIAGLMFNKWRIASIIIASIPFLLITIMYLNTSTYINLRAIAFNTSLFLIIMSGLYNNYQLHKIRKELESELIENQLID